MERFRYVYTFTAFPVVGPSKVVHLTPSWFRGQCPLRGLWLLTCHNTNFILIFRAADGKIWAWRLWNGRLSWRWAWLFFVPRVRCVTFLLVAVRLRYDFSYLILRQHTSPFRTRHLTTLHSEENCSSTNASNSKISTDRSRTCGRYLEEMFLSCT